MSTRATRLRWASWFVALLLSIVMVAVLEQQRVGAAREHASSEPAATTPGSQVAWSASVRRRPRWPRRGDGLVEVRGRVVDVSTGQPVAEAEVVASDDATESAELSAYDGSYQISLRPGSYRFFVRGERFMSLGRRHKSRTGGAPRPEEVAEARAALAPELLVTSDVDGVDLEVVAAATVNGRVRGPDGRPVAGALVQARAVDPTDGDPVLATDLAETDATGTYRLLVPARAHQIEARHPTHGRSRNRPIVALAPGQVREVDLDLEPGCIVTGTVTRDGQLVESGALERVASATSDQGYQVERIEGGRFSWSSEEALPMYLRAFPFKSPPSPPQLVRCDREALHDLAFVIPPTPADLSGTLVTRDGEAAGHVYLDIHGLDPGLTDQIERTDAAGAWESFTLPPGRYAVVARAPRLGVADIVAVAPARDLHLRMSGTGSLAGIARGLTEGTFELEVDCIVKGETWGRTRELFLVALNGGTFRIDGLPACLLAMTPRRGPWRGASTTVDIFSGSTSEIELDLTILAVRDIRGLLVDELGRPVAGATITAVEPPIVSAVSAADGRFFLRAPGGAVLAVRNAGHRPLDLTVPTGPGVAWDVTGTMTRAPSAESPSP